MQWLKDSAQSRETVAEVLEGLEELVRLHRAGIDTGPNRPGGGGAEATLTRLDPAKRFQVEGTIRGLSLAEHFSSARLPFRCPEDAYFATAKIMAQARSSTSFDAILQKVRSATQEPLPDYLVRVCIRFWTAQKPPLIEKVRARFCPVRPPQFRRRPSGRG